MPFATDAVCVSIEPVFTSVKTASVASISPTAHFPAVCMACPLDWSRATTALAMVWMNEEETESVEAVEEAIAAVVEASVVVDVSAAICTNRPFVVLEAVFKASDNDCTCAASEESDRAVVEADEASVVWPMVRTDKLDEAVTISPCCSWMAFAKTGMMP